MVERRTPFRAIALALSAFVALGIADSGLGVAWPAMSDFLGRSLSDLGVLLVALSFGYLAASTAFGILTEVFGMGPILVTGASLLAVSAGGVAVVLGWPVAVIAVVLMGLGAGLIDVGMNAHAALEFDRGAINNLHAAYGVGATTGPMILAGSLTSGLAWRGGYAALAGLQIVVAIAIWHRRPEWTGGRRAAESTPTASIGTLRRAGVLTVFLIYTGVEVATGQWSFSLLTLDRGMGTGSAGVWVGLYWGGLTVGRLVFGLVGERVTASRALDYSIGIALAGLTFLWWDPAGLGVLGLPMTGLGFAAVFPTLVSLTPARMGRSASTKMVGYQLAAANVGAAIVPWGLGLVAGEAGLGVLPAGLAITTVVLGGLHLAVDRTA